MQQGFMVNGEYRNTTLGLLILGFLCLPGWRSGALGSCQSARWVPMGWTRTSSSFSKITDSSSFAKIIASSSFTKIIASSSFAISSFAKIIASSCSLNNFLDMQRKEGDAPAEEDARLCLHSRGGGNNFLDVQRRRGDQLLGHAEQTGGSNFR
jgi:hypothetical protein